MRRYVIKHFKEKPTKKEIREVEKYHATFQDYCRVWLEDGSIRIYQNDTSKVCYFSNGPRSYYFIDFVNEELYPTGSFGKIGIIRSKKIIFG